MPDFVHFSKLGPADLRYSRPEYGTFGRGPRRVWALPAFHAMCERLIEFLSQVAGPPIAVVTAGFTVNRPVRYDKKGRIIRDSHREGHAFDIDSVWWAEGKPMVTGNAPKDVRRYLGVEATLRQAGFGVVLGYWYNAKHRGHFHVDDTRPAGWRPQTKNCALFVQLALSVFCGEPLKPDGQCGPKTLAAVQRWQTAQGLSGGFSQHWNEFLSYVATEGLGKSAVGG